MHLRMVLKEAIKVFVHTDVSMEFVRIARISSVVIALIDCKVNKPLLQTSSKVSVFVYLYNM